MSAVDADFVYGPAPHCVWWNGGVVAVPASERISDAIGSSAAASADQQSRLRSQRYGAWFHWRHHRQNGQTVAVVRNNLKESKKTNRSPIRRRSIVVSMSHGRVSPHWKPALSSLIVVAFRSWAAPLTNVFPVKPLPSRTTEHCHYECFISGESDSQGWARGNN